MLVTLLHFPITSLDFVFFKQVMSNTYFKLLYLMDNGELLIMRFDQSHISVEEHVQY